MIEQQFQQKKEKNIISKIDKKNQQNNSKKKKDYQKKNTLSKKIIVLPQSNSGIQRIYPRYVHRKRKLSDFQFPQIQKLKEICPLCLKSINDDRNAIAFSGSEDPSHFLCILEHLKKTINLQDNQRITYAGSGKFAIIQLSEGNNSNGKIIQYLKFQEKPTLQSSWRRQLAIIPEVVISIKRINN